MSGIVITKPIGAPSGTGVPGTSIADISILPGITEMIDIVSNISVKWIFTLINESEGKVLTGEVLGVNRGANGPTHTTYAIIGDRIRFRVSVGVSGTDMTLNIENLEAVQLKAHVVRINVTPV